MGIWIFLGMMAGSFAQESATVSAPDPKYGQIQGLRLNVGQVSVKVYTKDGKPVPVATVTGSVTPPRGVSLTAQGRAVTIQPSGAFQALLVLTGENTWLPMVATRQGKAQKAFAMVRFPNFAKLQGGQPAAPQTAQTYQVRDDEAASVSLIRKKWFIIPTVAYMSANHSEPLSGTTRSLGFLSTRLRGNFEFSPRAFGVVDAGYTPLLLSTNATGVGTSLLDFTGLVGIQFGEGAFRAGVGLGYGVETMGVSDLSFGYQNLSGVQLAPHISYDFSRNVSLLARFRYQMVLSLALFVNSVMTAEGDLSFFLKNGHPVVLRGAWTSVNFTTPTAVVSHTRFFAGLGYGF